MHLLKECLGGTVSFVDAGPLVDPVPKGLVLPQAEGPLVNHSWLDYFSVWEDAPGDCVYVLVVEVDVLMRDPLEVNRLVADRLKLIQMFNQGNDKLLWHEKLVVRFLVDVAFSRTPAEDRVVRGGTIHLRL